MASANQSQSKLFAALIAKLKPSMRRAFEQSVKDLREGVDWTLLLKELSDNNVDGAIRALNIEPAAFHVYGEEIKRAYSAGGTLAATTVNPPPGTKVSFRFDMTNERAEAWIRRNVGDKIKVEVDDQIYQSRTAILQGYAKGQHPTVIAKSLIGEKVNGKRVGGILGLDPYRQGHVDRMRAKLESGDPKQLRSVLDLALRDQRSDGKIIAAIKSGKPLKAADIDAMVMRYSDRMLKRRAEDIARTETGAAVMGARKDEWNQALDKLGKPPEAIIKTWRYGGGAKDPRWWHERMNGKSVRGLETHFEMPNGARMKHALDLDGGAKECVNCTCDTTFRIDHSWGLT